MGEAKRRRRQVEEHEATTVVAAYRRENVVHVVPGEWSGLDDGDVDDLVEAFCDAVRVPNAMRPCGWERAGETFASRLGERVRQATDGFPFAAFDRDGNLLRTIEDADDGSVPGILVDGHARHELVGDVVEVAASVRDGFRARDGSPVTDLRAAFAGLARIDAYGDVLTPADAPVSLQMAALTESMVRALVQGDSGNADAVGAHIEHLLNLATWLNRLPKDDPGVVIDLAYLPDLVPAQGPSEWAEMAPLGMEEVAFDLLSELDAARPGDPVWRIGPVLRMEPDVWFSRDEPGLGLVWSVADAEVGRLMRDCPPEALPNVGAQFAEIEGRSYPPELGAFLAEAETLAADGRSKAVRHEGLGLSLAVLDLGDGCLKVVAWPATPPGEPRLDPLMAETLADGSGEPDRDAWSLRRMDPSAADVLRTLASLTLLGALPLPVPFADYASTMLTSAHRRGAGIPDLCAGIAEAIRDGSAAEAFEPAWDDEDGDDDRGDAADARADALARAEAFGGSPDAGLRAVLGGIEDWSVVDLDRDLRNLRDAWKAGATLADLAMVHVEVVVPG